jgi:hypothetical protein
MLANDIPVINITIGVADSGNEIKNTLDTLKTFEMLVSNNKKTVPVAYFENSKETPMSKVDELVTELVVAIAVLFSRQNEGLDTRDVYNFLNVDRLSKYEPHAVGLESYAGTLVQGEHADTITVISAVVNKDHRGIDFVVPYANFGVLPSAISEEITDQAPIHLVTKAYPFNDIAGRLKKILADMDAAAAANIKQSEVLNGNEKAEGGFLVF